MAIRSTVVKGKLEYYITANHPLVFFDTWALNLFSFQNEDYMRRFKLILNAKRGTLVFSTFNVIEVVNREDEDQVSSVLNFIDSVDSAPLNFDPMKIIKKEKNSSEKMPWADPNFQHYFSRLHEPGKDFKFSDIFRKFQRELKSGAELPETFSEKLNHTIETIRRDVRAVERVKNRARSSTKTRRERPFTRDLFEKGAAWIVSNKKMSMPEKEWYDFLPVIASAAH